MSSDKAAQQSEDQVSFSILWVDDEPGTVTPSESNIQQWMRNTHAGIDLIIEKVQTAEGAVESIKARVYDLIITDYNLGRGKTNGAKFVSSIREDCISTDVVFYTRKGAIPDDTEKNLLRTGFIQVVPDDQVVPTAQAVISDRLRRFEKISYLRGMVISAFIRVETKLNDFFLDYYRVHDERQKHFRASILENSAISFGAKVNALNMIIFGKGRPKKTDKVLSPFENLEYKVIHDGTEVLRSAENERNLLAHCKILPDEERCQVFSMGEVHIYDRKEVVKVLEDIRKCSDFIGTLAECLTPTS